MQEGLGWASSCVWKEGRDSRQARHDGELHFLPQCFALQGGQEEVDLARSCLLLRRLARRLHAREEVWQR